MDADDFHELYKLLRGSRAATQVLDARALFLDDRMIEAHDKLVEAREQYSESRSRVLKQKPEDQVDPKAKDAQKQIKKLKRKQEKLLETLESFDELIPAMEKLAKRDQGRLERQAGKDSAAKADSSQPPKDDAGAGDTDVAVMDEAGEAVMDEAGEAPPEAMVARPTDISGEFVEAFRSSDGDDRFEVIGRLFGFQEVTTADDIHGNALYYIQTPGRSLIVSTPPLEEMAETVSLVSVVDDKPIKPFTRADFLLLGTRRKMVLLTKTGVAGSQPDAGTESDLLTDEDRGETASEENDPNQRKVLDMGAFSQLLTAAQRSGLVPAADQIGHVRDREFRMEKYDHAFQAINAIYSQFTASSIQRTQTLSREDADIASGKLKISPKDLLAKRARDRVQTAEIERANRRFQVVLEGLRILMHAGESKG